MKKILLAVFAAVIMISCCSVPQEVKDAFSSEFLSATDVKWDCDDDGYEVSYVVDGIRYETEYDKSGHKKATNDPQPASCTHSHGDCSHSHAHQHDHGACSHADCTATDSTACTHSHGDSTAACTHSHENCSHGK